MDQNVFTLPIRLLPRRGQQIGMLAFFGFFFGFSIFWMAGAAGIIDPNEGTINLPTSGDLIGNLFPLFGLPFAVVGICGLTGAVLKMLPGSPYYHLEINAEGLLIRSLFKQKHYAWRELPAFETLERRRRTKNGTRVNWYTVAMEGAPLEPGMASGATNQREVLRINADEMAPRTASRMPPTLRRGSIACGSWRSTSGSRRTKRSKCRKVSAAMRSARSPRYPG